MISITRFTIDNNTYFEVLVPEFPGKDNYYYQPTEKLHIYDIITIIYCTNDTRIKLFEDAAGLSIEMIQHSLMSCLENKPIITEPIKIGTLSLLFSIDTEKEDSEFDFGPFRLWSSPSGIQTWLYTRDNKIYLEISSTYPWLFSDPEPLDNYYSLDEYIKNYKPMAVHEISRETAQEWLEQCNSILITMEVPV